MNTRHHKRQIQNEQNNVNRVQNYSSQDQSSRQSQVMGNFSQSSWRQQKTDKDENSLLTFCQSQNQKNQQYETSNQAGSIQNNKDVGQKTTQNRRKKKQQASVNVHQSFQNNQQRITRNQTQNSKLQNQFKRCSSLQSLSDTILETQSKSESSQSSLFQSIYDQKSSSNYSYDSEFSNKVMTRSQALRFNNLFNGQQKSDSQSNQQTFNSSKNDSKFQFPVKSKKDTSIKDSSNTENISAFQQPLSNLQFSKIEKTKYKNKNKYTDQNQIEDQENNALDCGGAKTQLKQRKVEMDLSNSKNEALDYYSTTAKQIKDYKTNQDCLGYGNQLRGIYEQNCNNNYIDFTHINKNRMIDENQRQNPFQMNNTKIDNLFNKYQSQNIFGDQNIKSIGRKVDSALTSVTQCKDSQIKSRIYNSNFNKNDQQKPNGMKKPCFLFDDEEGVCQGQSIGNSVKSSDETHLNIDLLNIWTNGNKIENDEEEQERKQNYLLKSSQQNVWNNNNNNISNDLEFNSIFQKKHKNTLQKNQFIGMDNNFTVNYEKLRYSSMNSYKLKHFEFNCFRDRDLNVDAQFQNKLQEIVIDDDVQTDDDTLDHYVEVCFSDIITAIKNDKKYGNLDDDDDSSDQSYSVSDSVSNSDYLWDYFNPPNHSNIKA